MRRPRPILLCNRVLLFAPFLVIYAFFVKIVNRIRITS